MAEWGGGRGGGGIGDPLKATLSDGYGRYIMGSQGERERERENLPLPFSNVFPSSPHSLPPFLSIRPTSPPFLPSSLTLHRIPPLLLLLTHFLPPSLLPCYLLCLASSLPHFLPPTLSFSLPSGPLLSTQSGPWV